ncbi:MULTISPECIES: hypothetical protein [Empedobacter]|uniref:hypothetical protein n=1 Tax=Empedobacter TaxID=59734 RepID=UPI0025752187|nr:MULTISPECIES: hypothetical protein [Empedobacter]
MIKRAKISLSVVAILFSTALFACDACQLQQPKVTKGFTHGTGPQSDWDWFIVVIVIIITIWTFLLSLKYLLKPGEKQDYHIKYSFYSDKLNNYDER